ncbi:uncharacterized protein FHS55_003265 [Angulomicrobium tetraedrale]|uniref:Small ribosomal subunit protein bS1 n=1 Tax=Ancylobacter tetraedralis TaxID=217068 RepID=A0A839ZD28_9HYPH|nr:Tex family protein [Ancylobacter tetraedralis]MBB3772644.1 uncharacterized protein [Ancylobacter tetraedralis]
MTTDTSSLADRIARQIASEIGARPQQALAAIALLDEGATVPFIARYRKEATGGLDDTQLRQLGERLIYLRELEARRGAILQAVRQLEKLTPELEAAIVGATTKAELEDIYLPYKPKRRNKAEIARERGLGPLAEAILANRAPVPAELAQAYLTDEVVDVKAALDGARDIISEQFAQNAELLGRLRGYLRQNASLRSRLVEGKAEAGAKFSDYFDHVEKWAAVPSHRALAMLRGRNEDMLTLEIEVDAEDPRPLKPVVRMIAEAYSIGANLPGDVWLMEVAGWTWRVKLALHLSLDLMTDLRMKAETEAINVFARNLKDLLLTAPAGSRATMGLDPGIRTGVKVAIIDGTGKLVATTTVYPFPPKNDVRGTQGELARLIRQHKVELVAIGNGTGSRETEKLVAEMLGDLPSPKPIKVVVSEAGASVYSASEAAAMEFPTLDVSLRGAVSIARRLQDPLAELVKIEPKSIGVGQYQHDVDQYHLARALDAVVEDAVNAVGVDLNTASASLLARVSGLGTALAEAIVAHRDANGPFASRKQLLDVTRLGPRTFEQCAGFLRIRDGAEPLDASSVHPEAYGVARKIVKACGRDLRTLMGDSAALSQLDPRAFVDERFGLPTVRDIIAELDKPGRDPRPAFKTATFADGIDDMKDLKPGMELEGTVTNVAAFGAFVDIGVHQDGLVHVSQLADRFIKDAHEVVKVGDVVKVRVLEIDIKRKRISLSMRRDAGPGSASGSASRQLERAPRDNRDNQVAPGRGAPPKPAAGKPAPREAQGALGAALMDAFKKR